MYYSQHEQDKFLNENFFKNKKNGVFLDIGAHNGVSISNSLFFEKELEWTGICVEPMPDIFSQLRENRNCICINAAASDSTKEDTFLRVNGYAEMLSGLLSEYDSKHLNRINYEIGHFGGTKEEIKVQCIDVNEIILKNNISHIDYCSLDTEGNEFKILKAIDFDKITIDYFSIEINNESNDIKEFMASKQYDLVACLGCDLIYKRR